MVEDVSQQSHLWLPQKEAETLVLDKQWFSIGGRDWYKRRVLGVECEFHLLPEQKNRHFNSLKSQSYVTKLKAVKLAVIFLFSVLRLLIVQ